MAEADDTPDQHRVPPSPGGPADARRQRARAFRNFRRRTERRLDRLTTELLHDYCDNLPWPSEQARDDWFAYWLAQGFSTDADSLPRTTRLYSSARSRHFHFESLRRIPRLLDGLDECWVWSWSGVPMRDVAKWQKAGCHTGETAAVLVEAGIASDTIGAFGAAWTRRSGFPVLVPLNRHDRVDFYDAVDGRPLDKWARLGLAAEQLIDALNADLTYNETKNLTSDRFPEIAFIAAMKTGTPTSEPTGGRLAH